MGPAVPFFVAAALGGLGLARRFLIRSDLSDRDAPARFWHQAYPGDQVQDSIVSLDGRSALVMTGWGAGVICRGGDFAGRLDHAVTESDADGLIIRFDDVTAPRVRIRLTPEDAARWQERIETE